MSSVGHLPIMEVTFVPRTLVILVVDSRWPPDSGATSLLFTSLQYTPRNCRDNACCPRFRGAEVEAGLRPKRLRESAVNAILAHYLGESARWWISLAEGGGEGK